jgi:uncharacterized membrane protein YkvA (DUF1232 family)
MDKWKQWARAIRRDAHALYLAARDPRVPWYAKAVAIAVAAYALSPIDLIPDFIPVVGYLDDLIIVPLGIYFTLRLIPPQVVLEARQRADAWLAAERERPTNYVAAAAIIAIWLAVAYWLWTLWRAHSFSS